MLEQMRKSSRSLLIMVLFGIVIVVFIVNFGPQSQGTTCEQMNKEDGYAAKVGSQTITNNDFRGNQNNAGTVDCADLTSGGGTAGTANTWKNDKGKTSFPTGICKKK